MTQGFEDDRRAPADPRVGIEALDPTVVQRSLHEVEAQLQRKSRLLDAILEQMVQGLMLVNKDLVVEVCNRRAMDLLDLPIGLMARQPHFLEVLEYQWSVGEFNRTSEDLKDFVRSGGILDQPQCYERVRPDGRIVEVQSVPLDGGGVLRTYTDITERRKGEEQVRHRASHDGLTRLLNRETFLERLAACVLQSAADGQGFAVLYIDLDRFKPINDRLGHAVGDQVLAAVAERIRDVARDHDAVARLGGDEFAILQLSVDHHEQALGLAHRLVRAFDLPVRVEGQDVGVGVSAGIAIYPAHGLSPDALLRNADSALYRAKSEGGHGFRVHPG